MKQCNINNYNEFKELFRLLNNNLKMYKYHLNKSKISQTEKKLLSAFLSIKKNDKETAIRILKSHPIQERFLEAIRLYFIGYLHNNFGEFEFAVEHLSKSTILFEEMKENDFYIYSTSNLMLAYGNMKNTLDMLPHIPKLERMTGKSIGNDLLIYHAKSIYLMLTGSFNDCLELIENIWDTHIKQKKEYITCFQLIRFSILFQRGDYNLCKKVLHQYKKTNGFTIRANYKYMKALLYHISENQPIYTYKDDFQHYPELFYQLEVIKNLAIGDSYTAKSFWDKLSTHNPSIYKENFYYVADTCLFSVALDKHKNKQTINTFDVIKINSIKSNVEKIEFILKNAKSPVHKEQLIQLIFNCSYDEQSDAKLRKLIFNARKKNKLSIIASQGFYSIELEVPRKIAL